MVRRKLTSYLVTTLVLSVFAIVCELALLIVIRAPAPTVAGALPQAPGQATRGGAVAPAAIIPLRPPSRMGPAEWGRPADRILPTATPAHKTSLWGTAALGQPDRRGEYAARTDPTARGLLPGGTGAATRTRTSIALLGALMALAILAVSRRRAEAEQATLQRAGASQHTARPEPKLVLEGGSPTLRPTARPGRAIGLARDQAAEWERVRLVPT